MIVLGVVANLGAEPPGKNQGSEGAERKRDSEPRYGTGRPGDLAPEEEAKYDQIVKRFIQHDAGIRPDSDAAKAFKSLGPEAIPSLVRGFNEAAQLSHSCPVTMIARKLIQLASQSEDPQVLLYIRSDVGAGLPVTNYQGLINSVRFACTKRQGELSKALREQESRYKKLRDGLDPRP